MEDWRYSSFSLSLSLSLSLLQSEHLISVTVRQPWLRQDYDAVARRDLSEIDICTAEFESLAHRADTDVHRVGIRVGGVSYDIEAELLLRYWARVSSHDVAEGIALRDR